MKKLACHDEQIEHLLYQAVGYSLYRRNELRRSFFLLGNKRNGKSTFLDMVNTLLGEDNISNLDLSEIGHEFKTAELVGKLANIGDDINDEFIPNSAIFKKVVSGDKITVAKKHKDPFVLASYAKFFFSANSLPRMGRGKDSEAIIDRLVIIPFDATFSKTDPDYDPYVKYKLRDEQVIEALITKSIEALREVLAEQEFVTCDKVTRNLAEYERVNNPILVFFEELDEADYLRQPTSDVYRNYSVYCLTNNLQPMSAVEFSKQMKKHFNLIVTDIVVDKKKVRVYTRGD
jgi:putative DNA primase/helicase